MLSNGKQKVTRSSDIIKLDGLSFNKAIQPNCFMKINIKKIDKTMNPDIVSRIAEGNYMVRKFVSNNFTEDKYDEERLRNTKSDVYKRFKDDYKNHLFGKNGSLTKKFSPIRSFYGIKVKKKKPDNLFPFLNKENKKKIDFIPSASQITNMLKQDLLPNERQNYIKSSKVVLKPKSLTPREFIDSKNNPLNPINHVKVKKKNIFTKENSIDFTNDDDSFFTSLGADRYDGRRNTKTDMMMNTITITNNTNTNMNTLTQTQINNNTITGTGTVSGSGNNPNSNINNFKNLMIHNHNNLNDCTYDSLKSKNFKTITYRRDSQTSSKLNPSSSRFKSPNNTTMNTSLMGKSHVSTNHDTFKKSNSVHNKNNYNTYNSTYSTHFTHNTQHNTHNTIAYKTIKSHHGYQPSLTKSNTTFLPYSTFIEQKKMNNKCKKIKSGCNKISKKFNIEIKKLKSPMEGKKKKIIMDKDIINLFSKRKKKPSTDFGIPINTRGIYHTIDADKANLIKMGDDITRMHDSTALYLRSRWAEELESKAVNAEVNKESEFMKKYGDLSLEVPRKKLINNSYRMKKLYYTILNQRNKIQTIFDKVKKK